MMTSVIITSIIVASIWIVFTWAKRCSSKYNAVVSYSHKSTLPILVTYTCISLTDIPNKAQSLNTKLYPKYSQAILVHVLKAHQVITLFKVRGGIKLLGMESNDTAYKCKSYHFKT